MKRAEKFKEVRRFRIKCISIIVFFFLMVATGICVSDYSINALMKNQKTIKLVEVRNIDESRLHLNILNLSLNLDTSYIKKDMEKVRESIRKVFGF